MQCQATQQDGNCTVDKNTRKCEFQPVAACLSYYVGATERHKHHGQGSTTYPQCEFVRVYLIPAVNILFKRQFHFIIFYPATMQIKPVVNKRKS